MLMYQVYLNEVETTVSIHIQVMLYFLKEKVERISPLVIYLLIFTTFSFDDVWILLGED